MPKTALARCLVLASITLGSSEPIRAQDLVTGQTEFLSRCAACHGADGKGDGPLGLKLKTKPPDLTTLAKRNKGVFPQRATFNAVDGRQVTKSHRISDMPIWGCRQSPPPRVAQKPAGKRGGRDKKKASLSKQQKDQRLQNRPAAILDLACDPESVIRERILAVVDYLRRIQEK